MPTWELAERRLLFNPKTDSPSSDSPDTDQAKKGKKPKSSNTITTGENELEASTASGKNKRMVGTKKRKVGYKKGKMMTMRITRTTLLSPMKQIVFYY
jgi:hypothetical protein